MPLQQHLCSSEETVPKRTWAGIFYQGSNNTKYNVPWPLQPHLRGRNGSPITRSSAHILSLLTKHKWQITRYVAQQALEILE